MQRPGQRRMARLPVLEGRRESLEKCVFCPKLCRSACPVSNAEPRETVTPWGKMSMAYFNAHGDVPREASYARPVWACTGCFGCRESCDHRNDVTGGLYAARAALVAEDAAHRGDLRVGAADVGVVPVGATRTIRGFPAHDHATREATRELRAHPAVRPGAADVLLVGCGYVRKARPEARAAIEALAGLLQNAFDLVEQCCGMPLLMAGDAPGFVAQAQALAVAVRDRARLFVADAGCGVALRMRYPEAGVRLPPVEMVVERAARELASLREVGADENVRWHDPCQLGRGLGIFDAPRAVLTRVLGRAPEEFVDRREKAACSGAGGLLPVTMPEVARDIGGARARAHQDAGGGRIVTACASSLRALRGGAETDDLLTWIARAVPPFPVP